MTSKSSLWHQKVRHDVKNMLWWQQVRHCFKTIHHNVHDTSWRQKFAMKSKVCHEVKSCHGVKICYDVNDIKHVSWRKEHTMTLTKFVMRSKMRHGVQKYVMSKPSMTSKRSPWCQKVLHTLWHQNLGYIKISYDVKTFVITLQIFHNAKNTSGRQKVRPDVKIFVLM